MSNSTLSLIEFIAALSVLLFLHEFGHYMVGKLFGITAEEFGFGYPPRLIKLFSIGETEFTLNWIPFGAFVRFKGEEDPEEEGGLASTGKWKRLGTLLAGPLMNILTGILLFSLVVAQTGVPQENIVDIINVAEGSPAQLAGIQSGDTLVEIAGIPIGDIYTVREVVNENLGEIIEIKILRDEEIISLSAPPRENPPEGEGALGIVMSNPVDKIGFIRSIPYGGKLAVEQIRQILSIPAMLIRGQVQTEDMRLLSPKGIYDVYSQVREEERELEQGQPGLAAINIAWFFAVISVALGFSNLLPIPALDGGRILFIIPEILFGKRVPPRYENAIHFVGYISLLVIMAYVLFQDFLNPIVLH